MKRKLLAPLLCIVLIGALLAGCGDDAPQTFNVTIENGTPYAVNELYVSATASDNWGSDHLGSTNILKANGTYDITLEKYDYENYDVRIVDEDGDEYLFRYVTLTEGTTFAVVFEGGNPNAYVTQADGSETAVAGTLASQGTPDPAPTPDPTSTPVDPMGKFDFMIYNESLYDIYSIHMGLASASSEHDFDLLPIVLEAGESYNATGQVSRGDWDATDWTLYITDVDGDTSASFEVFNPWELSYVDIQWDNSAGGYVCTFVY